MLKSWCNGLSRRNYALYGGRQTVTLIPGDGIGPEVTGAVKRVFLSAGMIFFACLLNFLK